jgi:hypothetical protein
MSTEESPFVRLDDSTITPASITIAPNLYHQGSGAISFAAAGDADFSASASYDLVTSWRVRGSLEVDLSTSWSVGEGAWYWYRVEGECGPVECETFGVGYDGCGRMRFVTTVSARNLSEVCDVLRNPNINAPVNLKIATIQRYSRPVFRNQTTADECNVLQEVEFCHVPECLDYCVDESSTPLIGVQNIVAPYDDQLVLPEFPAKSTRSGERLSSATDISDVLLANASSEAVVFGLGYEYDDSLSEGNMELSADSVSACGCSGIGRSLSMRHSLNRSSVVYNFLRSNSASLPSNLSLAYKATEGSWTSNIHLGDPVEGWSLFFGFACQNDLWRLSLSARSGKRQTKLVVDIPPEFMCASRRPSAPIEVYFNQRAGSTYAEGIQVVTPPRTPRRTASFSAEVYVEGIFVPHVIYYDEMGLFKDSFWDYSPLEININPISKNPTTLMTLNGIA